MPQDAPPAPPDAAGLHDAACSSFPDAPASAVSECPPEREIIVSVRRDFPIRSSEKFGAWGWSNAAGARTQSPLTWSTGSGSDLTPSRPDLITGWSVGRTSLGSPGGRGGGYTTDDVGPIEADVLLVSGGSEIAVERTSGADGLAVFTTTGLSGPYEFVIEPQDFLTSGPAGPDLTKSGPRNTLFYRRFSVSVELSAGELSGVTDPYDPPAGETVARVGNRREFGPTREELPLSIKPDWWGSDSGSARRAGVDLDLVVIHCTSGARLGNALNHWFPRNAGPHYCLDIDGHLIKMENDARRLSHLSGSKDRWERNVHRRSNNDRSIGIEVINPIAEGSYANAGAYVASDAEQPYTNEQYVTLLRLCSELASTFPDIEHRFIGHGDVACGKPPAGTPNDRLSARKRFDPGNRFEWERLESAGIGMVSTSADADTIYDGVFATIPGLELEENDRDPRGTRSARLGGDITPGFTGTPIAALKEDLRTLGYSLRNVDGTFDAWTVGAVDRFKRHFFSGTRGRATGGTVDAATASVIRGVRLAYFPI